MTQKNLLISSMEKLTSHVRKSPANQEQIFNSLSRDDFKKILSNLDDDNPMLRKTSINLIAELISGNTKLKKKFCKTMDINLIPGKILFNPKAVQKQVTAIHFPKMLNLLKKQPDSIQTDCLIWFINKDNKNKKLQLQYIYKDKNNLRMQIDIDPQQSIIGFYLSTADLSSELFTTNFSATATQVSQQQKKQHLKNSIQPNQRKIISVVGSKVNSSMSDSQPKYQRNAKTTQLQTDRPRKFINNFVQQRKLNSFKGNETQRYTTLNAENINFKQRESFEQGMIQRSTMPKTTQSPYIPTLSLDGGNGIGGVGLGNRTDRVGQTSYGTMNHSKQLDFQKVKYQGIKITTNQNPGNRTSYGSNIQRNNTDRDQVYMSSSFNNSNTHQNSNTIQNINNSQNGFIGQGMRKDSDNSYNFKYIKPMATSNQQGVKFVNFFQKRQQQQPNFTQKKTIDVFQYIRNR